MEAKFKITKDPVTNRYAWQLIAPNGVVIAESPSQYSSIPKTENVIELVKKYAERAEIEK